MKVKCPECKVISTVFFNKPGIVLAYCPCCGFDLTCEPMEDEKEEWPAHRKHSKD